MIESILDRTIIIDFIRIPVVAQGTKATSIMQAVSVTLAGLSYRTIKNTNYRTPIEIDGEHVHAFDSAL